MRVVCNNVQIDQARPQNKIYSSDETDHNQYYCREANILKQEFSEIFISEESHNNYRQINFQGIKKAVSMMVPKSN